MTALVNRWSLSLRLPLPRQPLGLRDVGRGHPAGDDIGGGRSAAIAYTLIETAKLNDVEPQAWLTNVLGRIADHKITRINELLPWRYAQT